MGPFQADILERVMQETRDLPPEVQSIFEQMRGSMTTGAALGIGFIFSLFFSLCFYSIFGLFGGLLGSVMFRKNAPPTPPPIPA
jgi:predicted lipid-binding transport protein (Tim44 family)